MLSEECGQLMFMVTWRKHRLTFLTNMYFQEKMLPGVIMAMDGQVFEKIYPLTELENPL